MSDLTERLSEIWAQVQDFELQDQLTFVTALTDHVRHYGDDRARAERDRCIAILKSAEPNTRAEKALARIDDAMIRQLPPHIAGAIAEWLEATGDELADMVELIQEGADV